MNNKGSITIGVIFAIAIGLKLFTIGLQAMHDKKVENRNEPTVERGK